MEIKLHANATTTPRVRRYLQQSDKSDRELAKELGISVTTVRRWRKREQIADRQTTPKVVHKALIPDQVVLINALREVLRAPLDELLFLVNEGLGIPLSRATLNRYLRPAHESRGLGGMQGKKALKAGLRPDRLTLHYRLLAMPMDEGGDHHLLWAQEPLSGWCQARVFAGVSLPLINRWLNEVIHHCPADIQCIETERSKWLQIAVPNVVVHQSEAMSPAAIQVSVPLASLAPSAQNADALVQQLCALWNTGNTQKKLGECTPQTFLEGLRRGED